MLRDRPELAMRAVEESMRHSPAVCGTGRTVTQDVDFGGYLFPAGTFVMVNTFAANRDPEVYDDANRLDITREDAPPILTFGGGAHYCLGANLARLSWPRPRHPGATAAHSSPRRTSSMETGCWV